MSTSNNSNSNNNLANGASLEHCYTNLFSLIDLAGIKWLKLRAKDEKDQNTKKTSKKEMLNGENDDEPDDDDNNDELSNKQTKTNQQSTPKHNKNTRKNEESNTSSTSLTIKDPVLITHAKCLKEDILSSWKRIDTKKTKKVNKQQNSDEEDEEDDEEDDENDLDEDDEPSGEDDDELNRNFDLINNTHLRKELWIFWFEKEEPPNLKAIISPDLYVDSSSSNSNLSFTNNYSSNNNTNTNATSSSVTHLAISSNNGLPYECRSMLFKALHNLIEKSLIDKGFTRLGKWFVMPYNYLNYNLNKLNNDDFEFDNLLKSVKSNELTGDDASTQQDKQQLTSINPQSMQSSNESNACSPMSTSATNKPNGKGKINSNKLASQVQYAANSLVSSSTNVITSMDQFNHVSYSFSFFLHGSSRVCTSVDMKLHKPLRIVNTNDLYKLKLKMQQSFSYQNRKNRPRFKGLSVILAPYGISAKLIGYLSNDSLQSKLTCAEWQQFYSLKLYSNLPRILVVGLECNKIKLFYPNSFVFMIVKDDETNSENYFSKYEPNQYNLDFDKDLVIGDLHNTSSQKDLDENMCPNINLSDNETSSSESDCLYDSNASSSDEDDETSNSDSEEDDDENKENLFRGKKSKLKGDSNQSSKSHQKGNKKALKGRTNSLNSGIDLICKTENDKKEMDSLELTIDSVARNFGTSTTKGDTNRLGLNEEDDEPMEELNDDFEMASTATATNQEDKNKSPIVVIKKEPNESPSLGKSQLKRAKSIINNNVNKITSLKQKCKSFSAYSTGNQVSSLVSAAKTKLASAEKTSKSDNSREKHLLTLLTKLKSEQYLAHLFNSSQNHCSKMKNLIKLYLSNKRLETKIDSFNAKKRTRTVMQRRKVLQNVKKFNKRLNSIKQFRLFVSNYNNDNSKDMSYYHRMYKLKRKKNLKRFRKQCTKCTNQHQLLNNSNLSTSLVSSSNDDSGGSFLVASPLKTLNCKCCKFDYSTENHILLRHKQVDLISENLPLSFDLLDKCQLNITNVNQRHSVLNTKNPNKISFQSINYQQQQQLPCKCNEETSKTPSKLIVAASSTLNKTTKSDTFSVKQEPTETAELDSSGTKPIKLEPFSISTKLESQPTSDQSKQLHQSKVNIINISTQPELFHHRQCYFSTHNESNLDPALININKTVQLNTNKISKEIKSANLATKTININDAYINEINEESKQGGKCECKSKETTDANEPVVQDDLDTLANLNDDIDSDSSSDDSTKDLMKELEKAEKRMNAESGGGTDDDDEHKRVENELKQFISNLNKNELSYYATTMSDNEMMEANKFKLKSDDEHTNNEFDDELDDSKVGKKSNQLDENDYQFFTLDDNDSLLEAFKSNKDLEVKSEKPLKLLSSSSESSRDSSSSSESSSISSDNSDDDESLSSLSSTQDSSTTTTTSDSDESNLSNCKTTSSDDSSNDDDDSDHENDLFLINKPLTNGGVSQKKKSFNLDNYLFSNENPILNAKKHTRKFKLKEDTKKRLFNKKSTPKKISSDGTSTKSNVTSMLNNLIAEEPTANHQTDEIAIDNINENENQQEDVTFDKLYELNVTDLRSDPHQQQQTANDVISLGGNHFDKLDESVQHANHMIQPPASNKQMTPPKSNESIHLTQPLSNNPDLPKSTNILLLSNKTSLITASNMAPKYEDINNLNIFEEEESADEQQQQTSQQQVAQQSSVNQHQEQSGQEASANVQSSMNKLALPTPCLSVVMTPPSHENVQQLNQINAQLSAEDLFTNSSYQYSSINQASCDNEFTKSIKLNDYMTLSKNKQREKFSSLLVKSLNSEDKINSMALNDITDKLIVNKYNKLNFNLNEIAVNEEKKKIKKLKKEYNNLTKLKWMPPQTNAQTASVVNQLNGFDLKKTIEKKLSPKREFKSLTKSINLSLEKINNSVNNYKLVKNTNSTYIHLNSTNKPQHKDPNNSSVIIIDSPQNHSTHQQQQTQLSHLQYQPRSNQTPLQRTNSSNIYQQQPQSVNNQLNNSYTAPSTPINSSQQYYQQHQQVASPYHYQQPPPSVNSVNSYPGSVPPPPSNFNQLQSTTPTNNPNNTLITNPGSVGPNLNNTSQLNYSQQMSVNNNNTTLPIESPDTTQIATTTQLVKKENLMSDELVVDDVKLKPLENVSILNEKNYRKSNLNLKFYLNSLYLSLSLSDTFNNCYRDINFDSCTLCVCNNNDYLKGLDYYIYILNDLFNSANDYYDDNFNNLNAASNATNNESDDDIYDTVNEQQQINKSTFKGFYLINKDKQMKSLKQQKSQQHKQDDPTTTAASTQLCTCGFSAVVNRQLLSSKTLVINLKQLIKQIKKLKTSSLSSSSSILTSYLKLVELINSSVTNNKCSLYDKQYLIVNSNNCNGLFYEDFLESLNLNMPNSLLKQLIKLTSNGANQKNIKNYLINSILIRENYKWKKAYVTIKSSSEATPLPATAGEDESQKKLKKQQSSTNMDFSAAESQIVKKKQQVTLNDGTQLINNSIDLTDENLNKKKSGHYEHLKQNTLDLFDQKYSCAFLSIQEQHDLFYSTERLFENFNQNEPEQDRQEASNKLMSLNQLDENKSYLNVLKRLLVKSSKNQNKSVKFKFKKNLIHKWVYDKKEIKSNLELTKSLKQIQPLLEETVQKKYTTSKMWESFQGPLTWQHFCRLAFRDTSSNNISSHYHQNLLNNQQPQSSNPSSSSNSTSSSNPSSSTSSSGSSNSGSNNSSSSASNSASNSTQQQHQINCYEPEPIPSLLVSYDKEWMAISPYAVKFWDKLNLEPYAKPKNIAYVVLVPDFDSLFNIDFETLNVKNLNFEDNDPFNYSKKSTFYHHNYHHHHNMASKRATDQADSYEAIIQSIKEYFKELTSAYELCRLGLHRPALRIAPDNGFIRVPLYRSSNASIPSSSNLNKSNSTPVSSTASKLNLKTASGSLNDLQSKDSADILLKQEEEASGVPTGIIGFSKINSSDNLIIKDLQSNANKMQIDQWFDQILENKSTHLIGKNIRSYARIFKLLALKITNGYQSTLSSTIQASFFSSNTASSPAAATQSGSSSAASSNSAPNQATSQQQNTFASTIIPTHSAINLDRTIYEEYKPSRYTNNTPANSNSLTQSGSNPSSSLNQPATLNTNTDSSTSSLLSNLLNQNVQPCEINLDFPFNPHHNPTSPLDLHSQSLLNHHSSAQILTNYNQQNQHNMSNSIEDNLFSTSSSQNSLNSLHQQQPQQQQQQQKAQQNSYLHLTQNITSSPVLFVYIIDPFDYYLYNTKKSQQTKKTKPASHAANTKLTNNYKKEDDTTNEDADEEEPNKFSEYDLKRLRQLGLFKAYLELLDNIPDLFKYSLQFQIIPLSLLLDLQQQSTSLYLQSVMQLKTSKSNYSSCFATGFGTGCSDLDMDFKLSILKQQAFNVFSLSKRFFMSPAHNYYLQMQQQQLQQYNTRSKTLTYFGPTGSEERFLKENLLQAASLSSSIKPTSKICNLDQMKKWTFYAPLFVLAPSTISNSAVALAASNLFFKPSTTANPTNTSASSANKSTALNQQQQHNIGLGECNLLMPNFIQLNMSNSNYGYLTNNPILPTSLTSSTAASTSSSKSKNDMMVNTNSIIQQPFQQQSNVLFVTYCLSEDQRFLLTACCDENGELLESASINIEIDERDRRKNNHYARLIGLRKLWEFLIVLISQTCKPWRLVIGRLGRLGHTELRGWGCLLSKKNLQRVCSELKESCEQCNIFGNMEMPSILSACLISMETCDNICIYPESYSREDKLAAAALSNQQLPSNHLAQTYGVSCTHILTFPASAVIQPQHQSSSILSNKDGSADPLSKSDGLHAMEDFFDFFGPGMGDDEEMMADLMNDDVNAKGFNESGNLNENDHLNNKIKMKEALLNQEEIPHLDQLPLAVGYYISTAKCGTPLPDWLRGDVSLDTNFHSFKATLHIHNRCALDNDDLIMMKTEYSHKLDSSITYEVLRYVLERYNALSWLNIDPLTQDRKSCLPLHHTVLLQLYYAFKNYV